ncbi:MAG: DUF1298 domain-containing protein [Mycobacteriaceae bacterium]|nr:DUF1298 domain-containing protein [Mycobacteriaceae bacterium]
MFWLASRIPNDQFQLYCFDGVRDDLDDIRAGLLARARGQADLCMRVRPVPRNLDYPYWVPAEPDAAQIIAHDPAGLTWDGLTAALGALLTRHVDAREHAWRIHLFPGVRGVPHCTGTALVAVLQFSHALADGRRSSELARVLLAPTPARPDSVEPLRPLPNAVAVARGLSRLPGRTAMTLVRGYRADQERRQRAADTRSGMPLASVNVDPGPERQVRMLVRSRAELPAADSTVTVAVLSAISIALAQWESRSGSSPARLGAEVTVADGPGERRPQQRNNFGNVGVELYPDEPDLERRAAKIAEALAAAKRARAASSRSAARALTTGMPAPAMWHEIAQFPLHLRPATVTGNTVVSSVFRGQADLDLGGGTVRFTAGFPALSPVMGLTHGVHGIGDTVAISIVAGPAALPDIDSYAALLAAALAQPFVQNDP